MVQLMSILGYLQFSWNTAFRKAEHVSRWKRLIGTKKDCLGLQLAGHNVGKGDFKKPFFGTDGTASTRIT